MTKAKAKAKHTPQPAPDPVVEVVETAPEAPTPAVGTIGARGPRGVPESAVITILSAENPKRPGSKAHDVFSKYVDGMTVGEFCDEAGKEATPNIVYDAAHGFISVEGYDPAVKFTPKPKAEKVAKEPKSPKAKKVVQPLPDPDEALEVETETADD